jgi:serine protease inhibitor
MTVNPAIVAADNGLGLALFQTLQPSAAGNIAISPLSIAVALQILYNGAAGTTQQAMAATTVTIAPTAVPVSSFTMTLDRPFLYAIRDGVTGSLLFIGALMNPSAS